MKQSSPFNQVIFFQCICLFLFSNHALGTYYSQFGQDSYLNEHIFNNKKDGVFVDIGAYDGRTLSNTLFFEKELGWRGICVEPNPIPYEKLVKERSCICVNGCVTDTSGEMPFMKVSSAPEMLSGLVSKYDSRHLDRIKSEAAIDGATTEIIQVKCYVLNDLLKENKIDHIDYLSIDTEGGEYDILKSIDFDKVDIDIIDVENNYQYPEFRKFMESKNFVLINCLREDEIYRNKKYCQ